MKSFPLDFWHSRQVFFKKIGNSQKEFINGKGTTTCLQCQCFFSSKRFGIGKSPIWGVSNKGWEIRVRVRVLGGVELILLWESDVGNVGEDDEWESVWASSGLQEDSSIDTDDVGRQSPMKSITADQFLDCCIFFRSSCFLS